MTQKFKVILDVDTINGRKKINFKDQSSANAEISLSEKMRDTNQRLDLDVTMMISTKNKGKTIEIEMIDNGVQKKSSLLTFGNFFSVNIVQALRFYLRMRLEAERKTNCSLS